MRTTSRTLTAWTRQSLLSQQSQDARKVDATDAEAEAIVIATAAGAVAAVRVAAQAAATAVMVVVTAVEADAEEGRTVPSTRLPVFSKAESNCQ